MAEQNQPNQSQMKIATVKATVARGRSVDVPIQGKTIVVGTTEDGKPVTRVPTKHYIAGQEVELPLDEVRRLQASGYLVDPDNVPPPVAEGPNFDSKGPGQVRAA